MFHLFRYVLQCIIYIYKQRFYIGQQIFRFRHWIIFRMIIMEFLVCHHVTVVL